MFAWAARIGSRGASLIGRILDRIALAHVEAEHGEAIPHVLRQRRGHVDDSAARMGQDQAARQKMQLRFEPGRNGAQGIDARGIVGGPCDCISGRR